MRFCSTSWMLALGLATALCSCTRPASPAAPGPAQPEATAPVAPATQAARPVARRGPLANAGVVWLGDDHFQVAPEHVYQLNNACLSMPYQGRPVELCHSQIELASQWEPGPDAVKSPDGRQLAWLVAERTDTTVFCWRYERAEPSEQAEPHEPRCFAVPLLGISSEMARHPVFRFLQDARTIYVVDPSHIARTDIMHAFSPDLPPHNQSPDCVEVSIEIDEMMGALRLLEPPVRVATGTHQGSEVTFVYHLHFDAGLSGEAVSAHASVRSSGAGPFGNVEAFCDHDIGEVTAVTPEHVAFEHEGKPRRWYRSRAACQSDDQSDDHSKTPSQPIGPCVHWHE
jgi:hypothetical protein